MLYRYNPLCGSNTVIDITARQLQSKTRLQGFAGYRLSRIDKSTAFTSLVSVPIDT